MCGYFCIGIIDFMLKGKILTDFILFFIFNLFFFHEIIKKKNDDKVLFYDVFSKMPTIYPKLNNQQ